MVLSNVAEALARGVESVGDRIGGALFEQVVRLGVTGLAQSGKTVFITSLVANLIDRGRMPQLVAAGEGRILSAFLQPQPDDTLPRFAFEEHLAALTARQPRWPRSTRRVSELRLSLRVRPAGLLAGVRGTGTVHLDIVDYPGEWLLDLALLERDFAGWSREVLARIASREEAAPFRAMLADRDPAARHDEAVAQALARSYAAFLQAAKRAGMMDATPGRFVLPGDLEGSPVLTFAPLPDPGRAPRGSLWREFERRFEAYKREVVRPFFRDHFARIDRQVVLMDVLGAIHAGPPAVEELRRVLTGILGAFRPGRTALLARLLGGRRVDRILFAATKADYLHHVQHPRLTAIAEALMKDARARAEFAGARTAAMSIAALRATVEETRLHEGRRLDCVRGRMAGTGREAVFWAGELPEDPNLILAPAREGAPRWLDADFGLMDLDPAPLTLRPGEGPPHIRLDRAAQFLLGDRL